MKGYEKPQIKYFLNDKNFYLEFEQSDLKQVLCVQLLYKIDVYESKIEFLVDYLSLVLKKEKESLSWKDIGTYVETEIFEKEKFDIKQYI